MRDIRETPELEDVLEEFADALRASIRTSIPGVVISYDAATQNATIQPQIKNVLYSAEGVRTTRDMPALANVRVCFFQAGDMFVHVPVKPGDHVTIFFAETDLSEWRRTGANVDPGTDERLSIEGCYAVPMLVPDADSVDDLDPDNITIGSKTGLRMVVKSNRVEVGGSDHFVTRDDRLQNELDGIKLALDALATAIPATHEYVVGVTKAETLKVSS